MGEASEPGKLPLPPYSAAIVWRPIVRPDLTSAAPLLLTVLVPRLVVPSRNVTLPESAAPGGEEPCAPHFEHGELVEQPDVQVREGCLAELACSGR